MQNLTETFAFDFGKSLRKKALSGSLNDNHTTYLVSSIQKKLDYTVNLKFDRVQFEMIAFIGKKISFDSNTIYSES